MKKNSLKVTLAQLNSIIGDFDFNLKQIKNAVQNAVSQNSDLIIFPELFICSYPPQDRLEQMSFIQNVNSALSEVQNLSENIGIIIGAPVKNESNKGKPLYNAACFFYQNKLIHCSHKALIPNYDVFDEYRYFEPADEFQVVDFKNHKLAITICEDLWDKSDNLQYKVQPMEILMTQNPDIIINIAASPFDYLKHGIRKQLLSRKAKEYNLPLIYVNNVGAQTELLFDGGSMVISPKGELCEQLSFFDEDIKTIDTKDIYNEFRVLKDPEYHPITLIHNALICGIKDFFKKSNFKTAIIGLSGGIDSSIVAALAVEALGAENVNAVFMPTAFSSNESLVDAQKQADLLKIPLKIINIESNFLSIVDLLKDAFNSKEPNVAEENIQSRLRGLILMALSNKNGHILLNTSNKSEMATGYGTLYGDMCGALSVIGDLYKVQVYQLADYLNTKELIIPTNIIKKAPTAELRHNQKDTDSLPEYEVLDSILFHYIEQNASAEVISKLPEVDLALTEKIIKLVDNNEFKRFQSAPVLRISPKAFGYGRRFPLVEKK